MLNSFSVNNYSCKFSYVITINVFHNASFDICMYCFITNLVLWHHSPFSLALASLILLVVIWYIVSDLPACCMRLILTLAA
jgi:hypothetical protein